MTKKRNIILLLILLLLLLLLLWRQGHWFYSRFLSLLGLNPAPVTQTVSAPVSPLTLPVKPEHPTVKLPKPVIPKPVVPTPTPLPTISVPVPAPPPIPLGQEGMHRELIPKGINIVKCYYDDEIVAPGETFEFDIDGSGFTEAFDQMITVDPDALDVQVKNLRLVTTNQIHGQIEVGPDATTQYDYPKILIRGLPVFRAPDPFGVVRRGEVLDIILTGIDESGQSGRFQVITNLDEALFERFQIAPTTAKLEVSNIKPLLPFRVNGAVSIAPGLTNGQYGLIALRGKHELFRKDPLVDVVHPNVGRTGSIDNVKATVVAHRPGDDVEFAVRGSGFTPSDAERLSAKVDEFDMGQGSFSYVTQGQLRLVMHIPPNAPVGVYGVTLEQRHKTVYQHPSVFGIVPVNWLSAVRLAQPLSPGKSGTLQITGRDIAYDYVQSLQIQTDEPGLQISPPRQVDPSTVVADIQVSTGVVPGDYLLHVGARGKLLRLPGGSIIKINP